jgi:hypothetical protein
MFFIGLADVWATDCFQIPRKHRQMSPAFRHRLATKILRFVLTG